VTSKDLKLTHAMLETQRSSVRILDGYVNGVNAILFLEANGSHNGDIIYGSVKLVQENNSWKMAGESWD
jgi:hypothetical protein